MNLDALFRPTGVAVTGSMSEGKLGAVLVDRLLSGGYPAAQIFAVNPKARGFKDVAGYAALADIGKPLDLIVIASPSATVAPLLEEAGAAGIKAAIIITSGFGEAGHPELEDEVAAVCAKHGIRYIGPNCSGIVNTKFNLYPTLEAEPAKGSLAIVSQSGAVGGLMMEMSRHEGIGVGKFVSFGNGHDLNATRLIPYLADDPETSVIAMYAENIRDGKEFMDALSIACRKKPVVVIKSGRTASGQRAALSHTGSMAGADTVYDAAFAACGAIRADSIEDMFDICKAFAMLPPLHGNKLAIITNSGGPGVLSADSCDAAGLAPDAPSAALIEEFKSFLPPHAGLANPFDLTVEGDAAQYGQAITTALKEYDAALALYIGTPYLAALEIAERSAAAAKASGKPVSAVWEVGFDIDEAKQHLFEQGLPCYVSGERAVRAMGKAAAYYQWRGKPARQITLPAVKQLEVSGNALREYQAMALLAEEGVPTPPSVYAENEADAIAGCRKIGYPVVMKIVSAAILHKSDKGGVKLNIGDDEQAKRAFAELIALDAQGGVLIYPMLKKGAEVIVGFMRDARFGPLIAFGMGGVYTEILKDVAFKIAPLTKDEALEMIRSIKTYPLLCGARGGVKADLDKLADVLVNFSYIPFVYPQLAEGEVNPLFVYEDGAIAADARFIFNKE
ncbi:MAG: acetate--CoA ligase family protein [Bacillota bacterium]|nr:acetate--CoA ligase family protein [Bacillota bacterium]